MANLSRAFTVVTGGASGLGFATASWFAKHGAKVRYLELDINVFDDDWRCC
jgi:NAD(P)-dependent dehydrogenase (short-subunit alcohol dehydrogenase family)